MAATVLTGGRGEEREPAGSRRYKEGDPPIGRLAFPGLGIGAGLGGFEVLDAVAEEALLGEFFDEDDLAGDEDGGLAFLVRDGDLDEGLDVILFGAFETQAALGHVLAGDDVFAAIGMTDAGGVADFDARMLAAVDAREGRIVGSGRRHGKDGGVRLAAVLWGNSGRGGSGGFRRG